MAKLLKEQLYSSVAYETAKLVTTRYSTSFSIGILLLDKSIRDVVYGIYGFVRLADEIVDTFHNTAQKQLLEEFEADTWKAIADGISLNPVLHAFQDVVNTYGIRKEYISAFLHSMKMDLQDIEYDQDLLATYIYGSAEVVGLMCLQVYCANDKKLFEELVPSARALGSAFQKVNFLRDLSADIRELGRSYFPGVTAATFDENKRLELIRDIEQEFEHGLSGISRLPNNCRLGVYVAYTYYGALLRNLQSSTAAEILRSRIRVGNVHKLLLLIVALVKIKFVR